MHMGHAASRCVVPESLFRPTAGRRLRPFEMDVSRIEVQVYTDNAAAIALYAKFGFSIEGTCRRYAFRNGRHIDVHIMGRVRSMP